MVFEVPHHGQDQGFVRIILCEADPPKHSGLMKIPFQAAFQLQRTVPRLKRELCAPAEPELRPKDFRIQDIGDLPVGKLFIRCEEEPDKLPAAFFGQGGHPAVVYVL